MRSLSMARKGLMLLASVLAVVTVMTCAASAAYGAQVQDANLGSIDTEQLPDGEYTVDAELLQKSNLTVKSMASSAIDGTHSLKVENGVYTLNLQLGTLFFLNATQYMDQLGYYPSYSVSGSSVVTSGEAVELWRSSVPQGETATVAVPVDENAHSFAKSLGYIPILLGAPNMPVTPQDAVLHLDWTTLVSVAAPEQDAEQDEPEEPAGEEPQQNEDSSKQEEPQQADGDEAQEAPQTVDKSALESAIGSAQETLQGSAKVQEAKDALSAAIGQAQAVLDDANASQDQVDAAREALRQAVNTHNTAQNVEAVQPQGQSADGSSQGASASQGTQSAVAATSTTAASSTGLQAGHVYAVPMVFKKSGSQETSMSNQYFGDAAYVRPLSNGTYDVRFTTNRADYVLGLEYNGQGIEVASESGNSREYRLILPGGQTDRVLPVRMTIKPMEDLGAGPVTADMYLFITQADDKGGDSGQVAPQSKNSGTLSQAGSQTVAAATTGSSATTTAKTSDETDVMPLLDLFLAGVAVSLLSRLRLRSLAPNSACVQSEVMRHE